MSLEFGSNAAMVLSSLFLADCHCQAAPVSASADTAMSAASVRPASRAGRRLRAAGAAGFASGCTGTGLR